MANYVYILRFSNEKLYIGVSVNPKRRLAEHRRTNVLVGHAVRKYGEPELLLIYKGDRIQCFVEEQYLVDLFNTLPPNGYNLQRGGTGGSAPGPESRAKMVAAKQGRKISDETKSRMRATHKDRKPISEETRKRISKAAKRRGIMPSTLAASIEARKGKALSAGTRKKLSKAAKDQWARWRAEKSHPNV